MKARWRADLNQWEVRATILKKRRSFYGSTEAAALEKAEAFVAAATPFSSTPTLLEYAHRAWLPTVAKRSDKYVAQIIWAFTHIMPSFGSVHLDMIERQQIQAHLDGLSLSPWSKHRVRNVLSLIFDLAVEDRIVDRNPTRKLVITKERKVIEKPYDFEQLARLFHASEGHLCHNAVVLAAVLGLRKNECLGAKWSNLSSGALLIDSQGDGKPLKTASSHRLVPATPSLIALLERHKGPFVSPERSDRNLCGAYYDKEKGTARRGFYGVSQTAGLPPRNFHSLRKSAATNLRTVGCPEGLVSAILGHSTGNVTRLYLYDSVEELAKHVDKVIARIEAAGVAAGVVENRSEVKKPG